MFSNYPPGVTGNEYAIAGGADYSAKRFVEHECDSPFEHDFHGEATVSGEIYGTELSGSFYCPQCGDEVNWDEDIAEDYNDN